ncbi:MAG: helix-turn-helix transcriptional regulator [Candidatus Brocadiae bacterium]|nr:helix-turn-helix transcriptional regulator [Candidatus Brocadiia bacterium]
MATVRVAFANILKHLRKQRNINQEKFGEMVGLHRTYISQLERGLKSPSLDVLYHIANSLNIKLSVLMNLVERELKK